MKTKVLYCPSYDELNFKPEHLVISVSREELSAFAEEEMVRIAKKNGKVVETDSFYEIVPEDIVMLRSKSSIPKFNKPMIPVTVGKNLFDENIEEALIGMKKDEKKLIQIDGNDVEFEVLKVKTRSVPELTIEMVKDDLGEGYDDIETIEDFKNLLMQEAYDMFKVESYYNGPATYIRDLVVSKLDADVCQEEYEEYREKILSSIKREAMQEGVDFKEYLFTLFNENEVLTEDNIMEKVEENIKKDFLFKVFANALSSEISKEELEDSYNQTIMEYSAEANISTEDVQKEFSFEDFVDQAIVMEAQNKLFEKYISELEAN